jgi:hypothetical protein
VYRLIYAPAHCREHNIGTVAAEVLDHAPLELGETLRGVVHERSDRR